VGLRPEVALDESAVFNVEIVVGDPGDASRDGVIIEDADSEMEGICVSDSERL
jgi:hypothetical protein